jgi:hypothetical protein
MNARTVTPGIALALALLAAAVIGGACDAKDRAGSPVFEVSSEDPTEALGLAIQDEYRVERTYARVLTEHGDIGPFDHVVLAEQKHINALTGLYTTRGLNAPSDPWQPEDIPSFATLRLACEAGVALEEANVALYDGLLTGELPADVRTVFLNLQAASRDHHLPAFQLCVAQQEVPEEPPAEPPTEPPEESDLYDRLGLAIQDEYRTEGTYAKVLTEHGDVSPFDRVVIAEQKHINALTALYAVREWPVPGSDWQPEDIPSFATLRLACEAGVALEEANVALYDGLLTGELPADVHTVFLNLQAASRDHHLPAFALCVAQQEVPEEPPEEPPEESDLYVSLGLAIQDEYRTQGTYAKVLAEHGDVTPFSNILVAETAHVGSLSALYAAREWPVPGSDWQPEDIPSFATLLLACEAGVALEEANVALYDGLLAGELPADVRTVFLNLQAASRDHHQPAFARCAGNSR